MATDQDILSLIPQRPPFVMIDRLLKSDQGLTVTSFRVSEQNVMVFNGEFSEAGLMENIAQTAAAGAGFESRALNKTVAVGYIGAVKNLIINYLPKINDELFTEITVIDEVLDMTIVSGIIRCNNQIIAECEMNIFISK